jgi:cation diffusion facilitator CzcD-associated flavoprotein CzcO
MRVARHSNEHFNLACPVLSVSEKASSIHVETGKGLFEFDFLIFATGFTIDWAQRPFLAEVAPHVLVWSDVFEPPAGQFDRELSETPYLGKSFQFRERKPGTSSGIERIYCFCYPAALGHGTVTGDIPAISDGAERLARGLAGILYVEDIEQHFLNMETYSEPELLGDEWVAAAASERIGA